MSAPAVLAMAYGTPATMDDLERYYTHIRRGQAPPRELLDELRGRYEAIGGRSPLLEITRAQVAGLEDALRTAGHDDVRVVLGMKHAPPFIEDAARSLTASGAAHVVGLVLAPHFSSMSVGEYAARAAAALGTAEGGPDFAIVRSWATAPGYVAWLAETVGDALARLGPAATDAEVVFTARSLPVRILAAGDPYPDELRATAEAVAAARGLGAHRAADVSRRARRGRTPSWSPSMPACATSCSNVEQFACLAEARVVIDDWREDYNTRRPHSALQMRTPAAFAAACTAA